MTTRTIKLVITSLGLSSILVVIAGCTTVVPPKPYILPEEKIYTIPAGQEVDATLDGQPVHLKAPKDMKLVYADTLIRQEQELNNKALKAVKEKRQQNKVMGVVAPLLALAATMAGAWAKGRMSGSSGGTTGTKPV